MDKLVVDFSFDELPVMVCGTYDMSLLAYGHAELKSAGADYKDEFFVSVIKLDSGAYMERPLNSSVARTFEQDLFKRIADEIENPKCPIGRSAAEAWAEALEQSQQPDPDDERDRRRDDAAYFSHAFA